MRAAVFLILVALLCLANSASADKIGPPESYTVVSADGKFVFVMLAPKAEAFDGYKQSGLYKRGAAEPL